MPSPSGIGEQLVKQGKGIALIGAVLGTGAAVYAIGDKLGFW